MEKILHRTKETFAQTYTCCAPELLATPSKPSTTPTSRSASQPVEQRSHRQAEDGLRVGAINWHRLRSFGAEREILTLRRKLTSSTGFQLIWQQPLSRLDARKYRNSSRPVDCLLDAACVEQFANEKRNDRAPSLAFFLFFADLERQRAEDDT